MALNDPHDVHNFKIAFPAWSLEATRCLDKCRAIETFSLSTIRANSSLDMMNGRDMFEGERYAEQYKIMLESLKSNRLMNEGPLDEYILERIPIWLMIDRASLYWCYYKENNEYHQILKSDLGGCVQTSLVNSHRDYLFSFVASSNWLAAMVNRIYANISVANSLVIKQNLNLIGLGDEILDFDHSSFEKIPKAPDPFKYKISMEKELNVFNINQWATQTKVISTDWEWEQSSSHEDLKNPDYPIKSLICFKTIPFSCEHLDSLLKNEDIVVSDVVLNQYSTLYIRPRRWSERSNPRILSIAFAGENVEAVTLSIESLDSTTRAEQLMAFRQSLDFPVDDGRIVGFIFIGDRLFVSNVQDEILISIYKTFPHVNFMDISCRQPADSPTAEQGLVEGIRIHLVHL